MTKLIKLKNLEARWISLATPNEKFGAPGKYEITVVLNDEDAAMLKAEGANIKENNGEKTFVVRNPSVWPSGDPQAPPAVLDKALQNVDVDKVKKMGNGSIVNLNVIAKPYDFAGKQGTSFRIKAVQLVEFKEYTGNDDPADDFEALAGEF